MTAPRHWALGVRLLAAGPGGWLAAWTASWVVAKMLPCAAADAVTYASLTGLALMPLAVFHALTARPLLSAAMPAILGLAGYGAIGGLT